MPTGRLRPAPVRRTVPDRHDALMDHPAIFADSRPIFARRKEPTQFTTANLRPRRERVQTGSKPHSRVHGNATAAEKQPAYKAPGGTTASAEFPVKTITRVQTVAPMGKEKLSPAVFILGIQRPPRAVSSGYGKLGQRVGHALHQLAPSGRMGHLAGC